MKIISLQIWQVCDSLHMCFMVSLDFFYIQVRAMVQGRDRRVELGYAWALQARKGIIYPPKNKNSKYNPPAPGQSADVTAENNASTEGNQEITASA